MLKRVLFILCLVCLPLMGIQAQSVYMHEAQEEALEQEKEGGPFTGIVGVLLFFGIVYVVGNLWILIKTTRSEEKSIRRKRKLAIP